jgi:aldehyde dehydrogenase (NAD+)
MERAAVILRMADILQRRWDELIELNIAEAGSTRLLAQFLQVGTPLEHLRDYAERILPAYQFDTPMMPDGCAPAASSSMAAGAAG